MDDLAMVLQPVEGVMGKPEDRPTGEERKVLAVVSAKSVKLAAIFRDVVHENFGSASIEIDHAREGVRTNGLERLNTVSDVVDRTDELFRRYQGQLREMQEAESDIISLIDRMRAEFDKLTICPSCEGKKGYGRNGLPKNWEGDGGPGMIIKQWEDCGVCGGRGVV